MAGWHTRLWRRVKLAPGVTVNFSKSGPSLSLGPRGSKVTFGRRGIRQTVGIPGTGFYATRQLSNNGPPAAPRLVDQAVPIAPSPAPEPAVSVSAARASDDDQVVVYYGMATLLGIVVGLGAYAFRVPQDQAITAGVVTAIAGIVYEGLAHHHPGPARALVAVVVGIVSIATALLAAAAVIALGAALASSGSRRRSRRR